MSARLLASCLLGLVLLGAGCGGGGDSSSAATIVRGPETLALPFLPDASGEALTVGLRNLADADGVVHLTAYTPAGVAYPPGRVAVALVARGGARLPLATLTGGLLVLGGWLEVETRDPNALDPITGVPTPTAISGLVAAFVQRAESGRETDAAPAAAFRPDRAYVTLREETLGWQVVNRSFTPAAGGAVPTAVPVDVTVFDAAGAVLGTAAHAVPANGSLLFAPPLVTGRAQVVPGAGVPAGAVVELTVAAREADPQVFVEARLTDLVRPLPQRFVGFDLEFGRDAAGNLYDLGVLVTNPGATAASIVLEAVRREDGTDLLAQPRVVALAAGRTKWLATTTLGSDGLDAQEASPFDDLLGDVAQAVGLQRLTVSFSVPEALEVSARAFNAFKSFHRVLPGRKLTTDAMVCGVQVPATIGTGVRNVVSLMNPQRTALRVMVSAFTPGGVEYLLPALLVPAGGRLDWSPDGRVFTEEPTDPTAPPVAFVAFRLTGSGGMFFGARRERRDVADLLLAVVPHAVRDLRAD